MTTTTLTAGWPPPTTPPFPEFVAVLVPTISDPERLHWYPTTRSLAHLHPNAVARVEMAVKA